MILTLKSTPKHKKKGHKAGEAGEAGEVEVVVEIWSLMGEFSPYVVIRAAHRTMSTSPLLYSLIAPWE